MNIWELLIFIVVVAAILVFAFVIILATISAVREREYKLTAQRAAQDEEQARQLADEYIEDIETHLPYRGGRQDDDDGERGKPYER